MPVIVIDVEKSKASSKVQHSEDRTWTPYPLGRVFVPIEPSDSFVERQLETIMSRAAPVALVEYPALRNARLVPRAQTWEGLPNSKGMRW